MARAVKHLLWPLQSKHNWDFMGRSGTRVWSTCLHPLFLSKLEARRRPINEKTRGFIYDSDRQVDGQWDRHSDVHSQCSGGAQNCQIITYIKSSKKEKLTKKINTLLNNLLLPNSLCGPAGCRNYLHLFSFSSPSLCSAPLPLLMR